MIKLTNIRVPVGEPDERLRDICARKLAIPADAITFLRILRKSLDARNKSRLMHVYTTALTIDEEARLTRQKASLLSPYQDPPFETPVPGSEWLNERPVIVGAGPAGLLCAYQLAELGYQPLVLERGKSVRDRNRDVRDFDRGGPLNSESNYLFGEGGAGTFSDGKLTCRTTGADTDRVLEILAQCKGKPSIRYEAKPHLGSNRLPAVVKALRTRIQQMGGEFQFECRLEALLIQNGRLVGIRTNQGDQTCGVVVLAIGHSARDTIQMLFESGVQIVFKPFQMGVRIEHPQATVTRVQYGTSPQAAILGPADYTMNVHVDDFNVFTFCMCAGGYVMPSVSQHGYFCTNGMSRSFHESPFANSGIVTTVTAQDLQAAGYQVDPLAGIRYQESIERSAYERTGGTYQAPIQWAADYLASVPSTGEIPSSYARGVQPTNLISLFPANIARRIADGLTRMDAAWNREFLRDATLVAPEARGSCPIRMTRDPASRESLTVQGLYPIGEGAGFAGGIVSAAVDGLRTAKAIVRKYRPFRK